MKTLAIAAAIGAAMALATATPASAQAKKEDKKQSVSAEMDTNKDGMISKEEFMKHMEARWERMNKNRKAQLSREEVDRILSTFNP